MRNKVILVILALALAAFLCAAFPVGNEQPAEQEGGIYPPPVMVYPTEAIYPAPEEPEPKRPQPDPTRAPTRAPQSPITINVCPPVCDF